MRLPPHERVAFFSEILVLIVPRAGKGVFGARAWYAPFVVGQFGRLIVRNFRTALPFGALVSYRVAIRRNADIGGREG